MLKAIHKPTGNIVWAWALENDSTWIGKENDEWVAPRYMVYDYNEKGDIKVFFTKTHERDGSIVRCHFKHESNREIYDKESESKEHQMAKEGVYEAISNGLILIGGRPLRDYCKDIQFEYPLTPNKKAKVADVIAIFKEWHPIYGKGIIFEVQFSNQNAEITEERTFHRISEGYSVCWLWDGDFNDNKLKLVNYDKTEHKLNIIPFSKALEDYNNYIQANTLNKINLVGGLLDKKIATLNSKYLDFQDDLANKSNEVINTIIDGFKLELEEIDAHLINRIETVKELIKKDKENDIAFLFKNAIGELSNELKESLKNELLGSYNWKLMQERIVEELKKSIGERLREEILAESRSILLSKTQDFINKYIEDNLSGNNLKELLQKAIYSRIGDSKIEITTLSECKKCKNQFPIKSMEYESGCAYCNDCFNSLEDNWKKRSHNKMDKNFI